MANKINHKTSQVLMKTPSGYEHMFESISAAARFAKANGWTMALKMQVKGYFEDDQGNKYYRQDEMNTKNEYKTASAKMIKKMKPYKKKKTKRAIPVYVDGVFYKNCAEAARALNLHKSSISAYIGWGRREINGHIIETVEEHKNNIKETFQTPQIPRMPKAEIKDENISVVIDSTDPAIKAINERIVELLKQSGIYDEVKKLSQAIQKLSK